MDWQLELLMSMRLAYATLLGCIIGWERAISGSAAGARTYMAVSVGACIFSLISDHILNDASRIAAQVVSGIGFIGGGIILKTEGKTTGLTTAATLWATAGIGMASAYGFYILAAEGTFLVLFILILHRLAWWKFLIKPRYYHTSDSLETDNERL